MVAVLGLGAAAYGLVQTIIGFPSWDQHWIDQVSFASLNVNGVIRPFASFSSAQEYAGYLAIAIVIWIGAAFRIRYLMLSALALVAADPGARAGVVPRRDRVARRRDRGDARSAAPAAAPARRRHRGGAAGRPRVRAALVRAVDLDLGIGTTSGQLISHDVAGLSDPLNPQASTVGVHLSLVVNGVKSAFSDPMGRGIGADDDRRTDVRRRHGRHRSGSVEHGGRARTAGVDRISLRPRARGPCRLSHRLRPSRPLALIALGIVTITFLQWFNGGLYAVAFLPWLAMGWADSVDSGAHLRAERSAS